MSKTITSSNGYKILISDKDYPYFSRFHWRVDPRPGKMYPYREYKRKKIYLINELVPCGKGFVIDHKDRNTLNNTRTNIRICKRFQNSANSGPHAKECRTSKYKGVVLHKNSKRYGVEICTNYRKRHISQILDEEVAAIIYDLLAIDRMGEYSSVNFSSTEAQKLIRKIYWNKNCYGDPELWKV